MKWLAVAVALAGMTVAVALFGIARESDAKPAAAVQVQAAAPALPSESAQSVVGRAPTPKPRTAQRPPTARPCQRENDEDSRRVRADANDEDESRAFCPDTGDEREDDELEADENEARDDHAGDDEARDGKDDQAGDSDSDGSGD